MPAHCSTSVLRLMSAELLVARAAKVGLPVTREVAMLHRQLEQKAVELVSAGREGCPAQSGSKARSQLGMLLA